MNHQKNHKRSGFTLIELLVVFSIIGILSTVSIAGFSNYGRTQLLQTGASDVVSTLQVAKSRTQSQVKPTSCGTDKLNGYEVRICGLTGSVCSVPDTYELYVSCGVTKTRLSTKELAQGVSFSQSGTTSTTFLFQILTGGVNGNGTVVLRGDDQAIKTIVVSNNGTISLQ